jgi:uncharacterized membrane protein YeaQ/YmgE (transglycosylase-associated protein family)
MTAFIILTVVGGVAGFFLRHFASMRLNDKQAIVLGMVGAALGVSFAWLLLPAAALLLPAVAGSALVVWAVERYRNRVM